MPNIYMSPTGSDSNTGLSAGSPVLTSSKVMTLLANAPGTPQTVYLMGGTYTSRLVFTNAKNGTPAGRITVKNYPGERAVIAPAAGTTQYTWEHAVKFSGSYWGIEAEAPSDRRDWNTYMIAIDGGCTGIINRTGAQYTGSGYTYVAGDFMRGMSGLQFDGNATATTINNGTVTTSAEMINIGVKNAKKWGLQIARYKGPNLMKGCLLYKAQMENIYKWFADYGNNGASSFGWGYGGGIVSGSNVYTDGLGTYVPGPHVMEDNIIDHVWGESLGSYAVTDVEMRRNLIVEPHRLGLYLDAVQRFQVIDNDVLIPSNPDINDFSWMWMSMLWSSEKSDKVSKDGLVALNRFIGGPAGLGYGWKEVAGANPSNVLHAHNVCVGQSTRAFQSYPDPIDNSTVILQNNVFDGPVESGTATGTWRRNAFANAPATLCLGSGGFVNASLGLLKGTPLTKLGYTKEYCRPGGSSPLLEAGLAITSVPVGALSVDTDGDAWESSPTLGSFRSSAAVVPTVSASGIALFFGGATSGAPIAINEIEVAETIAGSDITGTATVRGTASISSLANMTDNNTGNSASMTGDSSVLMLWSSAKTIAEIRVNCSAAETAPRYLVAYSVSYEKGKPRLSRVGDWTAGSRDGSGWLKFAVSVDQHGVIMRARSSVGRLFG